MNKKIRYPLICFGICISILIWCGCDSKISEKQNDTTMQKKSKNITVQSATQVNNTDDTKLEQIYN